MNTKEKLKRLYVNDNVKGSKVAFIFSCPGKAEANSDEGKVCAGATGNNLNFLLSFLQRKKPLLFQSTDRYDYTIANSSTIVHCSLTGNTEPNQKEIKDKENIFRLKSSLQEAQIIICMGKKAQKALDCICDANPTFLENITRIDSTHLSPVNINTHNLKIEDIASEILKCIPEDV